MLKEWWNWTIMQYFEQCIWPQHDNNKPRLDPRCTLRTNAGKKAILNNGKLFCINCGANKQPPIRFCECNQSKDPNCHVYALLPTCVKGVVSCYYPSYTPLTFTIADCFSGQIVLFAPFFRGPGIWWGRGFCFVLEWGVHAVSVLL
jgi:hypothetical protein